MKVDPKNPTGEDRDRFVLAKGHAAPMLYLALAEKGFFPKEELKTLRQLNSRLQGHPCAVKTPGVELSTGPLGLGLSVALGMGLGARLQEKGFYTYVLRGDGKIQEGIVWEAAMAGAKYGLDNVVGILDKNGVQLDGIVDQIMPLGEVRAKWNSFGWNTLEIDGHSVEEVYDAIQESHRMKGKPILIIAHTVKGKGVSFMEAYPDRFFDVGIAEMNMAAMAAGISTTGMIPFVNTFACFMVLRAGDPIRSLIAYTKLNVKLAGTYAELSDSYDGASHHSILDISFMRAFPHMVVISPADGEGIKAATEAAVQHKGPVYLRIHRKECPDLPENDSQPFVLGKGKVLKEGKDITLVATGYMVHRAMEAARKLEGQGVSARVVNIHTVKPLDTELLEKCAKETEGIGVAEEHSIHGGLGGAVAEAVERLDPVPIEFVGVKDTFAESGDYQALLEKYGLTASHIERAAVEVLKKKGAQR